MRQASDNWQEAAVLPPYQRLVLDEAHHLEDVAAGHLGTQVTSRGVRRLLGRFERNGTRTDPDAVPRAAAPSTTCWRARASTCCASGWCRRSADARRASDQLFTRLVGLLDEAPGGQRRLDDDFASDPVWAAGLAAELEAALRAFQVLRDSVETIADRLEQADVSERRLRLLQELRAVLGRLEVVSEGLVQTLRPRRRRRSGGALDRAERQARRRGEAGRGAARPGAGAARTALREG